MRACSRSSWSRCCRCLLRYKLRRVRRMVRQARIKCCFQTKVLQAVLAINFLGSCARFRPSGRVLSVPTCPPSPYMVHGMSLRTQIPTLAGHAGTRHTTTKTHGERRKNSITPWQKRRQPAVCAVLRAHAKGPGSWRPLRGRGQLAGRTACAASMRTKMEAWTSSATSCGATEAPAQRGMTRCTMVHELSAPRRAFPTRSRT